MKNKIVKWAESVTVIAFVSLLFGFGIAFFLLPDRTFSPEENRTLQTAPHFSVSSLVNGTYTASVADYYADQFPLRRFFVGCKAFCELSLGKRENNNVIAGKDGYLITRETSLDAACLQSNLSYIADFVSFAETQDIPCTVAIAGRSYDVMTSALPSMASSAVSTSAWNKLAVAADTHRLSYLDLCMPLRAQADTGETVWYRTDHHWSTYGAYLAYREICLDWGITPTPWEDFTVEIASDSFLGTTRAKSGMYWTAPDQLLYARYTNDDAFLVVNPASGTTIQGFYDRSYLTGSDLYASFLGGNTARLDVTLPGQERPRLLLIKDSFAHAMVPFLAQHYDIVVIDLRYYRASVRSLLEEERIERVLFLGYLTSYAEDNGFGLLAQ